MKKYLGLVVVVFTLFIGIRFANAAFSIPVSLVTNSDGTLDCKTAEEKNADGAKVTTCNFKVEAKSSTTIGENVVETFEVKYDEPNAKSGFKITKEGELGLSSDAIQNEDGKGGSFKYTYTSNTKLEAGKTYTLFTIEFYSDPDVVKCGGSIKPTGEGGSSSDDDKNTVIGDEGTGVPIPMAIIGFGAVAGLAVYSVSSRKTKMHRI